MPRKGLNFTLTLVVIGVILLMTALTVIVLGTGGVANWFGGQQDRQASTSVEAACNGLAQQIDQNYCNQYVKQSDCTSVQANHDSSHDKTAANRDCRWNQDGVYNDELDQLLVNDQPLVEVNTNQYDCVKQGHITYTCPASTGGIGAAPSIPAAAKTDNDGTDGEGTEGEDSCFLPGTLITMADGHMKPIEEVESGDTVRSFNTETQELTTGEVKQVASRTENGYWNVNNGLLKVTGTHPIRTRKPDGTTGWATLNKTTSHPGITNMLQLTPGDEIKTKNGWTPVHDLEYVDEDVEVHNLLVVDEHHTFYANNILVHNKLTGTEPSEQDDPQQDQQGRSQPWTVKLFSVVEYETAAGSIEKLSEDAPDIEFKAESVTVAPGSVAVLRNEPDYQGEMQTVIVDDSSNILLGGDVSSVQVHGGEDCEVVLFQHALALAPSNIDNPLDLAGASIDGLGKFLQGGTEGEQLTCHANCSCASSKNLVQNACTGLSSVDMPNTINPLTNWNDAASAAWVQGGAQCSATLYRDGGHDGQHMTVAGLNTNLNLGGTPNPVRSVEVLSTPPGSDREDGEAS